MLFADRSGAECGTRLAHTTWNAVTSTDDAQLRGETVVTTDGGVRLAHDLAYVHVNRTDKPDTVTEISNSASD